MANIKKNFNFRNGVQVDDDNLLVTTTGLVGIGTTVPTESLDVRGNVKVIGDFTATNSVVGVLTITEASPTRIIGAGVSIQSGIVTAQGTGIVTFFGDARFLQGMPTSQWEDTNAGLGVSSIYNTGGTVGIGTTSPQFTLQIGGNTNPEIGVGISSSGDIKATGIISATTFSGDLIGNITGATTISGNVLLNADLDVDGHTNLDNVSVAGVTTFAGAISGTTGIFTGAGSVATTATGVLFAVGDGGSSGDRVIQFKRATRSTDINIQAVNSGSGGTNLLFNQEGGAASFGGAISATTGTFTGADINGDIDVDGHTNLDNVSIAGVTTFAGIIEGVAGQNKIPFLYSNMADLPAAGSYHGAVAHVHATGALYFAHAGQWWELVNKESDGRVGTGTENYNIGSLNSAGIIKATTELNAPLIGVGTDAPANPIQVRKSGNAEIQVTSDTGIAGITVGRESGTSNGSNAEIRFGSGSGVGAPYSSSGTTLDIINHSTGNFNYYLSANNPGGSQGDFHWLKGFNSDNLMTLTGGGALGIGITLPTAKLHVVGGGKITGNLEVTNNLNLGGNFTGNVTGNLTGDVTGNVTGNLTGLINSPVSGVSTITNLEISNVGIGTTANGKIVNISSNPNQKIIINNDSQVGIFTDTFDDDNVGVAINRNLHIKKAVSVGNTTRSAVDFSDAVNISNEGETGLPFNRSQLAYMIPPRVTTAQRNLLRDAYNNSATLISGAMVYVTDLAGGPKLQVWNGSAWETITSS